MLLVSADEMRVLDRLTIEEHGTPGHVLMERAGEGATRVLLELFPYMRRRGHRALICAGRGNNGGDGLVMARLLRGRGIATEVVLVGGRASEVQGDAARNLKAYVRGGSRVRAVATAAALRTLTDGLDRADIVVDAIFGTGLRSEVTGLHAAAIELINASGVPVLAVDIPSGLDADSGRPLGVAVQAEATVTFGFAKIGQVLFPGASLCGALAVVDIGLAAEAIAAHPPRTALLEEETVAPLIPLRGPEVHKGDCGHVLVVAGSFGKTGAAQLAARAALRAGAGLVTVVAPASLYTVYAAGVLEAMTEALPDRDGKIRFDRDRLEALVKGKTSIVVGPGIGTHADARRVVRWLLQQTDLPVVLDADALTVLAAEAQKIRRAGGRLILTPHPGEMARLLGSESAAVQADRVLTARRFAVDHGCTLVLKGARTVVAEADGAAWINPTGNPGMASGGMGDVLSGILGGLLAQGLPPGEAARLGVYLHGAVADRAAESGGEIGLLASDVIAGLREGLHALRQRIGV